MCGLVCWLLLVVVILQAPVGDAGAACNRPSDAPTTRVLLDSYDFQSLLMPADPWNSVGTPVTWEISSVVQCFQSVAACNASVSDGFLVTPFLLDPRAVEINVFVEYVCPTFSDTCNTDFSLFVYENSSSDQPGSEVLSNYLQIDSVVGNNTRIRHWLNPGMGFYLAFVDRSSCVEITRVRVLYTVCPQAVNAFVQYPVASSGGTGNGSCVTGAVPNAGPLSAQCRFEENFDFTSSGSCHCDAGREGINCTECANGFFKATAGDSPCDQCPDNSMNVGTGNTDCVCVSSYRDSTSGRCSECEDNFFMADSMCSDCPQGSTSLGGVATECTCNPTVATEDRDMTTTTQACTSCRADHYRTTTAACMACPANSSRPFDAGESVCLCDNNRATMSNAPNTTGLACVGCAMGFFKNAMLCTACPSNSMSTMYDDVQCTCNDGTMLLDGSGLTTVSDPCSGCVANFYKRNDMCTMCPKNSARPTSTDDEFICPCNSRDYRRPEPMGPEENCLPLVGFQDAMLILEEGAANKNARLILSVPADQQISVPISITADNTRDVNITTSVNIPPDTPEGMVAIRTQDNQIALEDNTTFTLEIAVLSTPFFIAGDFLTVDGRKLYRSTMITIVDDDMVNVGFTESEVSFNESTTNAAITIQRFQSIASDLQLRITGVELPIELPSADVVLTQDDFMKTISLTILNDLEGGQGNREVTLRLEYAGFSDLVRIGGRDTHDEIVITIIDDDDAPPSSAFPLEAIIGVCAGGAGVAVLLLIIIILCLCICRLRVNRQGFYPTYEDKTSEPPTMLRYSASLRSISSQTIIPVTEGRSVQKENEFYV